jgi:hypothetical protein
MEYHSGRLIISSEDVARLVGAAMRSLKRWFSSLRQRLPRPPARYGYHSRLYAERTDQELQAARDLLAQNQIRAAGAVAGVALELHLKHVAAAHHVTLKQYVTIAQLQDALRYAGLLDSRQRKLIQKLASIRNQCVHGRKHLPTRAQVERLIDGIEELRQTVR